MAVQLPHSLELLQELLKKGRTVPIHYTGKSMAPTFTEGEELLVSAPPPWPIPTGSVVVFEEKGGLTAHRIAQRKKQNGELGYVTRGDATFLKDPFLRHDTIVGVVVGQSPTAAFFKSKYLPWKVRITGWVKRLF